MTKQKIKTKYWECEWGYDACISYLMRLGFTEYGADRYLFEDGGY